MKKCNFKYIKIYKIDLFSLNIVFSPSGFFCSTKLNFKAVFFSTYYIAKTIIARS